MIRPNVIGPREKWNVIGNYYPGNDYVDILGLDGYNWGKCATKKRFGWTSYWKSFQEVFSAPLKKIKKLSPNKAVMIFETASTDIGGDKALWIQEALSYAEKEKLKAIIWFQVDKECGWKINSAKQRKIISDFLKNKRPNVQKWAKELLNEKN